MYVRQLTADHIRKLFNTFRDGTAADAIRRHRCRVALGECCIGDDMPGGFRYPTREEIAEAREELTLHINAAADKGGRDG